LENKLVRKYLLPCRILQLSLLFIGVIFLIMGIINGDALETYKKAVLICLECIGIG